MTGVVVAVILVSLLTVGLAHDNNCTTLGLFANNPATSCNQIYQHVHEWSNDNNYLGNQIFLQSFSKLPYTAGNLKTSDAYIAIVTLY